MAHALMYNQKMGKRHLFDPFLPPFAQKGGGGHFLLGAQGCYNQCLVAVQENSQQKYPNTCFYEGNSRHNACFIQA